MELAEQLDEFLDQADGIQQTQKQGFVIDDDQKADWAIRKIIRLQNKNEEIDQLADDRITKIQEWRSQMKIENDNSIEYLKNLLRPYAISRLEGKKKTIKMPSGNISFRAVSTGFFIDGEEVKSKNAKLTAYVKENAPEYLKVEESTNWTELKKNLIVTENGNVLSPDGEIIDFLTAVEYPDSITVKERNP